MTRKNVSQDLGCETGTSQDIYLERGIHQYTDIYGQQMGGYIAQALDHGAFDTCSHILAVTEVLTDWRKFHVLYPNPCIRHSRLLSVCYKFCVITYRDRRRPTVFREVVKRGAQRHQHDPAHAHSKHVTRP